MLIRISNLRSYPFTKRASREYFGDLLSIDFKIPVQTQIVIPTVATDLQSWKLIGNSFKASRQGEPVQWMSKPQKRWESPWSIPYNSLLWFERQENMPIFIRNFFLIWTLPDPLVSNEAFFILHKPLLNVGFEKSFRWGIYLQ